MKTLIATNGQIAALTATPEIWAAAKHYSPRGENLQRAFVYGFNNLARAGGIRAFIL